MKSKWKTQQSRGKVHCSKEIWAECRRHEARRWEHPKIYPPGLHPGPTIQSRSAARRAAQDLVGLTISRYLFAFTVYHLQGKYAEKYIIYKLIYHLETKVAVPKCSAGSSKRQLFSGPIASSPATGGWEKELKKGGKTKAVVQWPNNFHPNRNWTVSLGICGISWRSIFIATIIKIPPGLKSFCLQYSQGSLLFGWILEVW